MLLKDYRPLIARLQREHAVTPERYRIKVVVLAILLLAYPSVLLVGGLGGILSAVFLLDGSNVVAAALAAAIGVAALAALAPLLRTAAPLPVGRELTRQNAAKLFAILDKIETKTRRIRLEGAWITADYELRIQQLPRLGLLGPSRTHLIVGLPLLQILSRKEFAALLAHEFEHVIGRKGRTSAWIYRLRNRCSLILAEGRAAGAGLNLAWKPVLHLLPYFHAYSFVMARQSEFKADRLGSQIVGKRLMADALISQALGRCFLAEQFWPNFWAQADDNAAPVFPPHSIMRTALNAGATTEEREAWLARLLKEPSGLDTTEPCLNERLLALDQFPELPPRATLNAAQAIFGRRLPELIRDMDAEWSKQHSKAWAARHQALSRAKNLVAMFASCKPAEMLTQDQCRYGQALKLLGRADDARQFLKLAADSQQGSAEAAVALAELLHEAGEETAIHYLEVATRQGAGLASTVAESAARLYQQLGEYDKAQACREQSGAMAA